VLNIFLIGLPEKNLSADLISLNQWITYSLHNDQVKSIESISGGFSNNIWRINTESRSLILRSPINKIPQAEFLQQLNISKLTSKWGLSPKILGENIETQETLLEYIENSPWPSYNEKPEPYITTMRTLKCFHDHLKSCSVEINKTSYFPFSYIIEEAQKFDPHGALVHLKMALEKVSLIQERLEPWLQAHATICHGDFHQGNVLLLKTDHLKPMLIDFDSMAWGDPIFDVVKFSVPLTKECRLKMFSEYLGYSPSKEELEHFELIDQALLMVVALNRLNFAFKSHKNTALFSKDEMEDLLNRNALPFFLEVSFEDTSAKARQLSGLYAFAEFLRRPL